jgi:hypothetical protein
VACSGSDCGVVVSVGVGVMSGIGWGGVREVELVLEI